mgnify:CR=1 FL=1
MSESLKGKVAVVTGAASGIGLATTKLLIEANVKVFMVDWDEKRRRGRSSATPQPCDGVGGLPAEPSPPS